MKKLILICFFLLMSPPVLAAVKIIAAENFYGSLAQEIGGQFVEVINILDAPNQDPHLFSLSPSLIEKMVAADIIIYNGAGYDPWMKTILAANKLDTTHVICVADLMGLTEGSNPHIWYRPDTMPMLAKKIAQLLAELDPEHQIFFVNNLSRFGAQYHFIYSTVKYFKARYQGTPITATEPLYNDMADSLGLKMFGLRFQEDIMNDVTPSISEVANFEDNLRQHTVRLLIYNKQVKNPMTQRMVNLAKEQGVPVVGMTEMLPQGMTYITWMMMELNKVDQALQGHGE